MRAIQRLQLCVLASSLAMAFFLPTQGRSEGGSFPSLRTSPFRKSGEKKDTSTPAVSGPVLMPAGLADSSGSIGYFAGSTECIEAIDLATGRVLWRSHEAQRPLLLDGHHLLAQAGTKRNRLRIIRLDLSRQGECDLECDPVVFPTWVVTGTAHGRMFAGHWRLDKHRLFLDWEASAWYVGKTKPTTEQEEAARKQASGLVQIDLRSGRVEVAPAEARITQTAPQLPDHLEKKSVRWQGLIGTHWKVLALEEENGQQRFILHSCDRQNEKRLDSKELLVGKHLLARVSLDEKTLCLYEACANPEDGVSLVPKKTPICWSLFSVETGELLGRIPSEAGIHDVVVLGKRVFYLVPGSFRGPLDQPWLQPQILKAIDLKSGKKLWEHPVAGKLITPPPL
jgi:hypothetical protein